jgi:microcystin-dependent protein
MTEATYTNLHEGDYIGMETFLGNIALFPYSFTPVGWAVCNGALLQISQNTALFSLIGTNFGGDGITTFALPDLRSDFPTGMELCISMQGIYPSRN